MAKRKNKKLIIVTGINRMCEITRKLTHRYSKAKRAKNGTQFSKNFSSHLVGSENAILSRSRAKFFHFCMVEQNTHATFVNSSKQRRLRMDCTGSEFAVYCR